MISTDLPPDSPRRRRTRLGVALVVVGVLVAGGAVAGVAADADSPRDSDSLPNAPSAVAAPLTVDAPGGSASTRPRLTAPASTAPSRPSGTPVAGSPAATGSWPVAGPADLAAPLAGMPAVADPMNIYADAGANMFSAATSGVPYRIYVPNSGGSTVSVIDPATYKVIATYRTGSNPQHVVPAYDLSTLYATNDRGNSLTPIDPHTGKPAGPNIAVDDPYNMYFTPDGRYAIVVAEAHQHLDFRDPHTFALEHRVNVNCPGVDHIDFSANGAYLVATCEFSGRLVRIDLHTLKVVDYLDLPGSAPQDIKLDPTGHTFYVADKVHAGVWMIDAATFRATGFIATGPDAHGLYPSRDARSLYVTNRGNGTISVIDFATHQITATWRLPGGGSPDMGGVSPDGKVFWLSGRYNSVVYAISTTNGQLIAKIAVGSQPHGVCVWPQPGRYSLGHTGVTR